MKEKIGVGIVTYNRVEMLKTLLKSIAHCNWLDEMIIVNDGDPIELNGYNWYLHQNEQNLGVGKSKNIAMKYLLEKGCDHIFIIEDDMVILDDRVFDMYIEASKVSGIQHFNYGPGSPFNRVQKIQNYDLHNRHLLDQHSKPNPKLIINYGEVKISLYEHTVAMFSYFSKKALEDVGLYDEDYYNAWEHVDHTYRFIKKGYHPPFWWFADIYESEKYLMEAPNAINDSTIANNTGQWEKNVLEGRELYKNKHGHYPNNPPPMTQSEVLFSIKQIYEKNINRV